MSNSPELLAFIAEYEALDRIAEPARACEILERATALVDRATAPKKWAAFRYLFAEVAALVDRTAAIAAYRDALTVFEPDDDREPWLECQAGLGLILAAQFPPGSDGGEEAIRCLERVIEDDPSPAEMLATLYSFRDSGDPQENWRKRIRYIELALTQIQRDADPVKWAKLTNELAVAQGAEPALDYAAVLEKRIATHLEALAAVSESDPVFVEIGTQLGSAYLDRGVGNLQENASEAEVYLRRALALCPPENPQRATILLLLGRCLIDREPRRRPAALEEALLLFEEARQIVAMRTEPELRGNVEKFDAIACLELLRDGRHDMLPKFLKSSAAARRLAEGPSHASERRKLWQIEADGFLTVSDFANARNCCREAMTLCEDLLATATTTAGRLERIWDLRDSGGLLAYCSAKTGGLMDALEALERTRALLWSDGERTDVADVIADLIPTDGALLFPIFAAPEGVLIIATHGDGAADLHAQFLPDFGKTRMLELQRGPTPDEELGGWLRAYCHRNSQPEMFRAEIDSIGHILHDELWTALLAKLEALGVAHGAELVWFPQGGSGIFPMQAAWRMRDGGREWLIDHHVMRFAPSLKILREADDSGERPQALTAFADPTESLPFSALETEWIVRAHPGVRIVAGGAATGAKLVDELATATDLHLATHGRFDLNDPLESSIALAHGERLTLRELAPQLRLRRPRFVALSACETAVTRVTSLAEESLGFPVALLAHGVRSVLATQWPVDDLPTALLIGRFYRERAEGCPAAGALRRAQCWLRDVTILELSKLLRELTDEADPVGSLAIQLRTSWRGREPGETPFAHPYFWAAFTLTGNP